MRTYHDCSGLQRDILCAIAALTNSDDKPHGLAIKEWLADNFDKTVCHTTLYYNLEELVEKGLIDHLPLDNSTNAYFLTDAGRQCLNDQATILARLTRSNGSHIYGGP